MYDVSISAFKFEKGKIKKEKDMLKGCLPRKTPQIMQMAGMSERVERTWRHMQNYDLIPNHV